jgi:hypothetical protein
MRKTNEPLKQLPNSEYKADYAEYDEAVRSGNLVTDYDPAGNMWGITEKRTDHGSQDNNADFGGYRLSGPWGKQERNPQQVGSIRPDYDPRAGSKMVKSVTTIYDGATNTTEDGSSRTANYTITHWGGVGVAAGSGRGDIVPGLYLYYTPVLNDSLIVLEAQFCIYRAANTYDMLDMMWRVGSDFDVGGFLWRGYNSGPDMIRPKQQLNSWGSGITQRVACVLNSSNSTHTTGLYGAGDQVYYQRRMTVTEYENPNPYGEPVNIWTPQSIHF